MSLTLAIDTGNAHTRAALIDPHEPPENPSLTHPSIQKIIGMELDFNRMSAPALIEKITCLAERITDGRKEEIAAVSVGLAAAVDKRGNVYHTNTPEGAIEQLHGPLLLKLQHIFGQHLEFAVGNRANMMAWGESKYGWGKQYKAESLVVLSVGGIASSGIIANGHIFLGAHGVAGQLGHMLVDPSHSHRCDLCKQSGCLSSIVGGRAILKELQARKAEPEGERLIEYLSQHRTPTTQDCGHIIQIDSVEVDARAVVEAAGQINFDTGDPLFPLARDIMERTVEPLGRAIGQIASLLDPLVVVLGGIFVSASYLEERITEIARKYRPSYLRNKFFIERSQFPLEEAACSGDEASLYGAAAWVWDKPPHL